MTVGGSAVGACTDTNPQQMDRNCSRAQPVRNRGQPRLPVDLPPGRHHHPVSTSGGTGTAYLYYDPSTWASSTTYTADSTAPAPARA
ncbi:hypothetical protein GXW82_03850 [Streptacidiphilus sp. 4-A2]|nr:hypothetical protein [Streptacidiphilus sp. 4-A2]